MNCLYIQACNAQIIVDEAHQVIIAHGVSTQSPDQEYSVRASMREKLSKGQGKTVYSWRKVIVEPVFGQIEQGRGFRRFSQRGQTKVRCEWALVLQ